MYRYSNVTSERSLRNFIVREAFQGPGVQKTDYQRRGLWPEVAVYRVVSTSGV